MISLDYLRVLKHIGDVAERLDELYDKRRTGVKEAVVVGEGLQKIDEIIPVLEGYIKAEILEIQRVYKESGFKN